MDTDVQPPPIAIDWVVVEYVPLLELVLELEDDSADELPILSFWDVECDALDDGEPLGVLRVLDEPPQPELKQEVGVLPTAIVENGEVMGVPLDVEPVAPAALWVVDTLPRVVGVDWELWPWVNPVDAVMGEPDTGPVGEVGGTSEPWETVGQSHGIVGQLSCLLSFHPAVGVFPASIRLARL